MYFLHFLMCRAFLPIPSYTRKCFLTVTMLPRKPIPTPIATETGSKIWKIDIMKYIGATDFFVRSPFVIEGILIGIIGSLLYLSDSTAADFLIPLRH